MTSKHERCQFYAVELLKVAPYYFLIHPVSCPNFIHAWKYECNTRHLKSMYSLRVTGFFKYNVTRELSCVEIEMWIFTRKLCVHFSRVCFCIFFLKLHILLEDHKMYIVYYFYKNRTRRFFYSR